MLKAPQLKRLVQELELQDRIRTVGDWDAFFALFPWLKPDDWEEHKGELPKRTIQ